MDRPEFLNTYLGENQRYRVEKHLGAGGMGDVYRATDTQLSKQVAVKIMTAVTSDEETRQQLIRRFRREIAVLAPLTSPNIVQVSDSGLTPQGYPYYVMEYLQGQTLGQVLRREGCLSVERALRIMIQICTGLAVAHKNGVIHRDLKPDNIFLLPGPLGEFVKILDFGIAKIIRAEGDITHLTAMGFFVGTFRYAAPEQCLDEGEIDQRADIYSLGVLFYEMLSGTNPFGITQDSGNNTYRWLDSHIRVEAIPLRTQPNCQSLPPALEAIIMRCLKKSPEERFASVEEIEKELRNILIVEEPQVHEGRTIVEPSPISPTEPFYRPQKKPIWQQALLGILILLGLSTTVIVTLILQKWGQHPLPGNPTLFVDLCLQTNLEPETRKTVDVLLQIAQVKDCITAERILLNAKTLDMSQRSLVDLKPLQEFTQLKKLNLSDNQIVDISPLGGLVNLTELDLSNNRIEDGSILSELTQLKTLNLLGNLGLQPMNIPGNPNPNCPLVDPQETICVAL
jgi:serine/threonine protein kinase